MLRVRMAYGKRPLLASVSAAAANWRTRKHWSAVLRRARQAPPLPRVEPERERWGRFELRGVIAQGAFGTVYRALDPLMNRAVALKVLHDANDPAAVIEEARTLAAVNHPNVVTAFEVHEDDGVFALAMDYIEGPTVERYLEQNGPMGWREAALMGFHICLALDAVHDAQVLHRDIKAHNVIRCARGDRYVLTDFGAGERKDLGRPGAGRVIGTPAYLAPEILLRGQPATIASDIYSLGVLLYHAVTNDYPVPGTTFAEVEAAHAHGPISLAKRQSNLPRRFIRVVDRAVDPDPAQRQRSALELKDDLAAAMASDLAETAAARFPREVIPEIPSVAVLPFVNAGSDENVDHICSGVAWEIITGLGKLPGLRVAPRVSSFAPQHAANPDAGAICEALKVDAVLQGQVRKTGTAVRITAQLVSGANGQQLWADAFDEQMHLGDVQETIAQRVVRGMKVRLGDLAGTRLTRQHTDNRRAYNFYLRGRHSWAKRYDGGFVDAVQQFEEAIKEDAAYAPAHAGLADTYAFIGFYSIGKPRDAFAKARIAADRALALDHYLPEAYTSRGLVKLGNDWDLDEAALDFLKAIELDKSQENPLARIYLSWVYVLEHDEDDALREAQLATDAEPDSPLVNAGAGHTVFLIGRDYNLAIKHCDDALHFDGGCLVAKYVKAACMAKMGRLGDAIRLMEEVVARESVRAPFYLAILGNLYGRAGRNADAQALLNELAVKPGYVPPHAHAFIHAGLNDLDRAFQWQAKAAEHGASPFTYYSPLIDNMKADPRHARDMTQMGWRR